MKIVIVGDGKVGGTLAEQLSLEGHDITIIDNNAGTPSFLQRYSGHHERHWKRCYLFHSD